MIFDRHGLQLWPLLPNHNYTRPLTQEKADRIAAIWQQVKELEDNESTTIPTPNGEVFTWLHKDGQVYFRWDLLAAGHLIRTEDRYHLDINSPMAFQAFVIPGFEMRGS